MQALPLQHHFLIQQHWDWPGVQGMPWAFQAWQRQALHFIGKLCKPSLAIKLF
jgi:hypothetical protein